MQNIFQLQKLTKIQRFKILAELGFFFALSNYFADEVAENGELSVISDLVYHKYQRNLKKKNQTLKLQTSVTLRVLI